MGRPAAPEEAKEQYRLGQALAALGRMEEARAAWQAAAEGPDGSDEQNEFKTRAQEALQQR